MEIVAGGDKIIVRVTLGASFGLHGRCDYCQLRPFCWEKLTSQRPFQ